jgi:excisionase family DNA binding protein
METQFDIRDCNFTVIEAARHLKVSRSYLYQLIAAKKIKVAKLGSRTIVPGAEIQRFVKSLAAHAV